MKGDAEARGVRARRAQQRGRFVDRNPELSREVVAAGVADREADKKAELRRLADQPERHRLLHDLRQLVMAVEGEIADPVFGKGGVDRAARLDRVHKMHCRCGQHPADQRDLGQGGAVEMADSAGPYRAQHARVGVALDGVEHIARKGGGKAARRGGDRHWTQAIERRRRALARQHLIDRGKNAGPGGTRRDKAELGHRTILHEEEASPRPLPSSRSGRVTGQVTTVRGGR